MVSIIWCALHTLLWQSPIQTVNANSLIGTLLHTVHLKVNLNDLITYVHRLNNLYIALNNNDIASTERYTLHLKHIAHGQSFSIFGFSRTIKGGTLLWYCIYVHFETPNQLPPITRRVRVRTILMLTLMNRYICHHMRIYKCAIPVHACAGHVLLSKCRDSVNVCVLYIQDSCITVLIYTH